MPLSLNQKLQLATRPNIITFIDEGLFLRAYNQSAFSLVKLLGLSFKLNCCEINKYNHLKIIYCGLPKSAIFKRFPNAIKTEWGFELHGDYCYNDYLNWFTFVWAQHQSISFNAKGATNMSPRVEATSVATTRDAPEIIYLPLNIKQQTFLQQWQKQRFSSEDEKQFIASLKRYLK